MAGPYESYGCRCWVSTWKYTAGDRQTLKGDPRGLLHQSFRAYTPVNSVKSESRMLVRRSHCQWKTLQFPRAQGQLGSRLACHTLHPRTAGKRPVLRWFIRTGISNVSYVKTRQSFLESSAPGAFCPTFSVVSTIEGCGPSWGEESGRRAGGFLVSTSA